MMTNQRTVRINSEAYKKLEEIAETMEVQLDFRISKAAALEQLINEKYKTTVVNPKNLMLRAINESSEEKKKEFQRMLDEIEEQGHEPEFTLDAKGNFIWNRK